MKRLWLVLSGALALCTLGCGPQAETVQVLPADAPTATPAAVVIAVPAETPAPTEVPTPSPTPEPASEPGTVFADGVGVLYTTLARGALVEITGEQDAYYTLLLDGVSVLVEKRLIRADGNAAYQSWTGYAKKNAKVYASPYLEGDVTATLKLNTKVTVLEDLDGVYLITWGDAQGYADASRISNTKNSSGGSSGGGGSSSGGSDGGDIQLSWRPADFDAPMRLSVRREGEASVPTSGTVLADGTEAYLVLVARGETLKVTGEDETSYEVLIGTLFGRVPKTLVRLADAEPYAVWDGYAESDAPFYPDYRMRGEAKELKRNAGVHVLEDLGTCYLAEVDGTVGYIPKDEVSKDKVKAPSSGGGGSSGGDWTAPAL